MAVLGVLVLAMGALWLYAVWAWSSIDRVDTAGSLSSGDDFTNYLVVGTDSRETFDPDDPAADDVGLGFEGSRSDSMMVLHIGPSGNHIVSLPRDLRVNIPGAGQNKLNAALSIGGAPLLIQTVQTELQIPIHRYLEVDLAGFMAVVDAVDGITVDFPAPACDVKSGLMIRTSGPVLLDSRQALAYVRSRSYVEFDAAPAEGLGCQQILSAGLGAPVGSDLDRTARQRDFLLDTLAKAGSSRNPLTLISVLDGLSGGLRVDDEMSMRDAISLARKARGLDAETHGLPVADSGNDLVMTGDAGAVLDLFRSGG